MEVLDLHGIPHVFVRNEIIRFVEDNWDSGNECQIITGMSDGMKKIVTEVLDEYKIMYTNGDGIYNFGFIQFIM